MKEEENPKPQKVKKPITFARRFRRFKRHFVRFFTSSENIKAFQFTFQMIFIYFALAAFGLMGLFFFYQNYLYFILALAAFALLYIANFAVIIAHHKTIMEILNFTYHPRHHRSAKSKEGDQQSGCRKSCSDKITALTETSCFKYFKLLCLLIFTLLLLDIPILFYLIRKQNEDVDKQIKDEELNEKNVRKLVGKIADKEKFDKEVEIKRKEIYARTQELKALKIDREFILPYKFGFFAIFGYIPCVYLSAIFLIDNPHQITVYPHQNLIIHGSFFLLLFGSIIGLYEISFFDKTQSRVIDAIKWFLMRFLELLTKSLLTGYFFKFSLYEETPLLLLGITYLAYSFGCTFLFTLFDYEKQDAEAISSNKESKRDEEQPQPNDGQQPQVIQEKGCCHVFGNYIKSLLLNLYARVLYLPYKETPLGMKTLTFYQIVLTEEKKMRREEVAPETWRNLMNTYDISSKLGTSRRSYTHIVHSLRFFELFHLALFSICKNIIQGQYLEMVESKKFSIYYQGKPITIVSIGILLFYYLRAANRTIHEKSLDISGIDE